MSDTQKSDIKLRNELVTVVIIKILLLALIWWLFFKDAQVSVNDKTPVGQAVTGVKVSAESGR